MEQARAAVSKLTGNRGHHTTVEETVNPAITNEVIKPHRHEEATQAIDREVHQHHHHTTVQPLQAQEILPEKHQHNMLPVENREFRHDNESETKQKLEAHMAHFQDSQRVEQTRVTQSSAPTVTGEHVHHHVHETVIPVVHKEVIQPEVVHTTIPIHETHIAATQHHGLSALPMKTLEEFKAAGGSITGGRHGTHEEYEGQPRQYNEKLTTTFEKLGLEGAGVAGAVGSGSHHHGHHHQTESGIGGTSSNRDYDNTSSSTGLGHRDHQHGSGLTGSSGSGLTGSSGTGLGREGREYESGRSGLSGNGGLGREGEYESGRSGLTGSSGRGVGTSGGAGGLANEARREEQNLSSDSSRLGGNHSSSTTGTKKPSLMDRLNPMKDTDGDGKGGIMD